MMSGSSSLQACVEREWSLCGHERATEGTGTAHVERWLQTWRRYTRSVVSGAEVERRKQIPVTTPCPLCLSGLLRASRRCGRPRTEMEHSP
jgi:hypothetical protein